MELSCIPGVEAPEVNQLARRVNLCLKHGLGLVQHRRCVDAIAPIAREQVCAALEDCRACLEPERNPVRLRCNRGRARSLYFRPAGKVHLRQHVAMVVRDNLFDGIPREDLLAINDAWHLHHRGQLPVQLVLQRSAFRAAGGVVQYRFVGRMTTHASVPAGAYE